MRLLRDIARGNRIAARVVVVAAHPDDEILALGGRLPLFENLHIVYLTDGAPRDLADARRAGCADRASYAALRRSELVSALGALGAAPEVSCYGCPDQEAVIEIAETVGRLSRKLTGAEAVVTHAYEHGHPEHDAAALAVALACDRLGRDAPAHYEFPGYHLRNGRQIFGAFWPDTSAPETVLPLDPGQRHLKRIALDRFGSQAAVLALFPEADERLRPAPRYDFRAPAPPGAAWYDRLDWETTSASWRRYADAVLASRAA